MSSRPPTGQWLLWLLLYGVLLAQTFRFMNGAMVYGVYLHWTGQWAVHFLLLTLAVTPLRRRFAQSTALRWLLKRRRDLGVACFAYAAAHTLAYLLQQGDGQEILRESLAFEMFIGWLAFVVFSLLALTSNDLSVRRLGRKWKTLHKVVFVAAVLTYLHWILTAFDPLFGYAHFALALVVMAMRLPFRSR